jgi:hypothetical protein
MGAMWLFQLSDYYFLPTRWDVCKVAATFNSRIACLGLGPFPLMLGKFFLAASFPSFIISRVLLVFLFSCFPLSNAYPSVVIQKGIQLEVACLETIWQGIVDLESFLV